MTNQPTKPLALNIVARSLVPFFVAHLAAYRAYSGAHVNAIRAAGGRKAHGDATYPRYRRARAALVRALARPEVEREDKRAALEAATQILRAETSAREAGRSWDADAAVRAWQSAA